MELEISEQFMKQLGIFIFSQSINGQDDIVHGINEHQPSQQVFHPPLGCNVVKPTHRMQDLSTTHPLKAGLGQRM